MQWIILDGKNFKVYEGISFLLIFGNKAGLVTPCIYASKLA